MRTALAAALLIVASAWDGPDRSAWLGAGTASAQSNTRSTADVFTPSIGLPLPSIGLPLPTIGLPLPPMGLQPRSAATTPPNQVRGDRPPRGGDRPNRRGPRTGGAGFVFIPAFGWPYVPDTLLPGTPVPSPPSLPPAPVSITGRLRVSLQSGVDPQIYVDGFYVGLLSDASGELTLEAGAHALELKQDGYETLHVDIQVPADGSITYRGTMKRLAAAPAAVAQIPAVPSVAAPEPSTIYMIPGCYVGNVPPTDASLPAGCDAARAVAFPSRP